LFNCFSGDCFSHVTCKVWQFSLHFWDFSFDLSDDLRRDVEFFWCGSCCPGCFFCLDLTYDIVDLILKRVTGMSHSSLNRHDPTVVCEFCQGLIDLIIEGLFSF
jgi:hypothetical protein